MLDLLSRRTALKAAVLAVGYATSTAQPSGSPTPVDASQTPLPSLTPSPTAAPMAAEAAEFVEQTFFLVDWSAGRTYRFPRVLSLSNVLSDVEILIRWDQRLFTVSETVLALTDQVIEVKADRLNDGTVRVTMPVGTSNLFLDASPLPLYPFENVDTPVATSISIVDHAAGEEVELFAPNIDEFAASPWGVELSAQWTTAKGLIIPQSVQILSVGPNPVPAGVTVEALCASAISEGSLTSSDGVAVSVQSAENRSLVQMTLTTPLASAESRLVLFAQDDATTVPVVNPTLVSRVSVDLGEDPRTVRQTGKLSIFPLTDSGIPVSTFKEVNTTA